MFATLLSIALFAVPALSNPFTIQTPKDIQSCAPTTFTWSGGVPSYDLVIVASDAPCGDILADLGGGHQGTSLTWSKAIIPSSMLGKNVSLSLQDGAGNEAWSNSIPYIAGDTSCLNNTRTGTFTLSIPPSISIPGSQSTPSGGAVPAGAANVGHNPLSGGALTSRQMSGSVFIASALAALLAFSL